MGAASRPVCGVEPEGTPPSGDTLGAPAGRRQRRPRPRDRRGARARQGGRTRVSSHQDRDSTDCRGTGGRPLGR